MSKIEHIEKQWQQRDLLQQWQESVSRIEKEGSSIFTELFAYQEPKKGPLNGALVSIKDLFNVTGYKTQAGSVFLEDQLAEEDAEAVAKLRDAGASFLGHTNMTELAYSGLGLNPHYGTPDNPLLAGRIPGGSTSGGAVSVALGMADVALGTDTGGSLRIPAAFCGLTGFKPSQQTVSRSGCLPLSNALDSIGPMAKTVAECELVWHILSDHSEPTASAELPHYRFVVPNNFGMDSLDPIVSEGFEQLIGKLEAKGYSIERRDVASLEVYKTLPIWQFSAFESQAYYGERYALESVVMDPRVASRIAKAKNIRPEDFLATRQARQAFIKQVESQEANTVFLLPTVAVCAPALADLEQDAEYDRLNLLCLRNTSLANVLDGCSVSLPFMHKGEPLGFMLTALNGQDQKLLDIAKHIEYLMNHS